MKVKAVCIKENFDGRFYYANPKIVYEIDPKRPNFKYFQYFEDPLAYHEGYSFDSETGMYLKHGEENQAPKIKAPTINDTGFHDPAAEAAMTLETAKASGPELELETAEEDDDAPPPITENDFGESPKRPGRPRKN